MDKRLHNKNFLKYKEGVEKVYKFLNNNKNSYGIATSTKLYHITSKQVVPCKETMEIVEYLGNGCNSYPLFWKEQNGKKLANSIKSLNVPSLCQNKVNKKWNHLSSSKDINKVIWKGSKEHRNCLLQGYYKQRRTSVWLIRLFGTKGLVRLRKHKIMLQLESHLKN